MATRYAVFRGDGVVIAESDTVELAKREREWHSISGTSGPLQIGKRPCETVMRAGYPWPRAKLEEFRQRYPDTGGDTIEYLAIYFGTSVVGICRMARRLGLVRRKSDPNSHEKHRGKWTVREEQLIDELWFDEMLPADISLVIPRTRSAIAARLSNVKGTGRQKKHGPVHTRRAPEPDR